MASTLLIVGATSNTGRNVVKTLAQLQKQSQVFAQHKILALTRSANGATAKDLARIPGVEVMEQNWVEITPEWLRQHRVERAFIASHIEPRQFAEESTFLLNALRAGVQYVVRISTTAANVRPDCPAYYARQHWAIEQMLGAPEFAGLHWTSLQPNIFSTGYLLAAADLVKHYRATGQQQRLKLIAAEDDRVGIIDPDDVGLVAAHLLVAPDTAVHNKAKYILNGPQDISGRQIVQMVEQCIGTGVEDVTFKDTSFVSHLAQASVSESKNLNHVHRARAGKRMARRGYGRNHEQGNPQPRRPGAYPRSGLSVSSGLTEYAYEPRILGDSSMVFSLEYYRSTQNIR